MSIPPPIPKTPPKTPASRAITGNMHLFDLPPSFELKSSTSCMCKVFFQILISHVFSKTNQVFAGVVLQQTFTETW